MQCSRCQYDNPPGMKFCGECAAPLASKCPSCGAANPPEHKFCGQCAAPLRMTPAAKSAAPESYTPKHLAEKILTSKSALEGERKQVTVLFADLKGSMELLADRDPEEARKLLDPVLEQMMEAVHRYEGTVNQVMGDGIMALFGAPLAHEDHAVRACYAALRMQESVKRYAEGVRRSEGILLQIRVGLNSGEVVVRSIGSDLHMDYSAIGQTTHLAARMEQMAAPGSILIPPETLRLAEDYMQVKPLGPMPVKGLPGPIEIYEITGASLVRSRFQAASIRGLTRFVGRDVEMEQLSQALDLARAGHGQVVAVVGEPGVGKSRLYWEFAHSHRIEGWFALESRSISYGKATSYLPVIDLLKAYFEIEARDERRRMREKVTGKVLGLDESLRPLLPPLLALLDLPVDETAWQGLDPSQRRQRTIDAIKRLLLRETQVQPLIVIFEDLHWIDSETQAVLESLVESLPTAQLLLLVNYRPEYRHSWGSKTYYRQLQVNPLPATIADDLLRSLLGNDPSLRALVPLLIRRTEGNPFFLEESVRTLVETGALVGEPGGRRLARVLPEVQVPTSVQAVLAARIDRLAPEDKRVLQAAAVIGKDVPLALLSAIANASEAELRRSLANLQTAEFLYETQLFPDLELTFKHALTHEVTYGSLLHERRKDLHARIVDVIERAYVDRLYEQVERLAYHAVRGERWEKAVHYLREAGRKASVQSANSEAVGYFEQALSALLHLPQTDSEMRQAIDIRLDLRRPLYVLGEMEAIGKLLSDAKQLAEMLKDPVRNAWVTTWLASHLHALGRAEESRQLSEANLALVETIPDVDLALRVEAMMRVGYSRTAAGSYGNAAPPLRAAIELIKSSTKMEESPLHLPWSVPLGWLSALCAEVGDFAEGFEWADSAARVAKEFDVAFGHVHAAWGVLVLRVTRGTLQEAIEQSAWALALSREQVRGLLPYILQWVGYAMALAGRAGEGGDLLEEALQARDTQRIGMFRSLNLAQLAHACLLAGDHSKALRTGEEALESARERGERGQEVHALRVLAEAAAASVPQVAGRAEGFYHQALILGDELGTRPLVAHCNLGLGKLYQRTGKPHGAQEHFTTATTMYREMGMTYWLEKAEEEMKELGW